jgi:hypothetical protein
LSRGRKGRSLIRVRRSDVALGTFQHHEPGESTCDRTHFFLATHITPSRHSHVRYEGQVVSVKRHADNRSAPPVDYYAALEVDSKATQEQIRTAYKKYVFLYTIRRHT